MIRELYRALLEHPGDYHLMVAMADAWLDVPNLQMADAYRWAAENGKWPCRRDGQGPRGLYRKGIPQSQRWVVYDWDREGRESHYPPCSRLPLEFYHACCRITWRRYGGPNRAFTLLAQAMVYVASQQVRLGNSSHYEGSTGTNPEPTIPSSIILSTAPTLEVEGVIGSPERD